MNKLNSDNFSTINYQYGSCVYPSTNRNYPDSTVWGSGKNELAECTPTLNQTVYPPRSNIPSDNTLKFYNYNKTNDYSSTDLNKDQVPESQMKNYWPMLRVN